MRLNMWKVCKLFQSFREENFVFKWYIPIDITFAFIFLVIILIQLAVILITNLDLIIIIILLLICTFFAILFPSTFLANFIIEYRLIWHLSYKVQCLYIINALYFTSYLLLDQLKLVVIFILAGQVRPIRQRVQSIHSVIPLGADNSALLHCLTGILRQQAVSWFWSFFRVKVLLFLINLVILIILRRKNIIFLTENLNSFWGVTQFLSL